MEIKIPEINKQNLKDIQIVKNVYKGYGLAYINSDTVFVEKAVENDLVDISIHKKKSKVYFAKIKKLKKPSKFRQNNIFCDAFEKCGGCDWLYINYKKQLSIKKDIISELYPDKEIEIYPSKKIYHYRNKNFMPISILKSKPQIGMYQKNTHNVIEHKKCFLIPPIFDEIISFVKDYLISVKAKIYDEKTHKGMFRHIGFRINSNGEIIVVLVTKNSKKIPFSKLFVKNILKKFNNIVGIVQNINREKGNKILGKEERLIYGKRYFYEVIGRYKYKLDYSSFFQINYEVTEKLYEFIKRNISEYDIVIDAFCGVGTIGIYVSEEAKSVYLIENNTNAFENIKVNIKLNGVSNCFPVFGDANKKISEFGFKSVNTLILDPPRKGIDKQTLENLPSEIKKIIYVSCNPLTQKRDINILEKIGFKIRNIQIFDMFPNTYHIETVIILNKEL